MDSGQLFKHWSIPQAIFKQIHFCTTSSCRFSSLKETALIAVVPAHPGSAAATGSSGRLLRHRHIQQGRTSTPPNLRKTSRRDPLKLPGQGVLIISCPLFGYRHFPFIFLFTNGRHWPETWIIPAKHPNRGILFACLHPHMYLCLYLSICICFAICLENPSVHPAVFCTFLHYVVICFVPCARGISRRVYEEIASIRIHCWSICFHVGENHVVLGISTPI